MITSVDEMNWKMGWKDENSQGFVFKNCVLLEEGIGSRLSCAAVPDCSWHYTRRKETCTTRMWSPSSVQFCMKKLRCCPRSDVRYCLTRDCQTREERLSFRINSSWQAPHSSAFHSLQRCQELRQIKGEKYFIHPVNSEFRDTHYLLSQVQSSGSNPGQECSLLRLVFFGSLKRRRMLSAFESSKWDGANARTI